MAFCGGLVGRRGTCGGGDLGASCCDREYLSSPSCFLGPFDQTESLWVIPLISERNFLAKSWRSPQCEESAEAYENGGVPPTTPRRAG